MNWKKLIFIVSAIFCMTVLTAREKPRVFVFTDINIDSGDPDDRQSLIHLLWYANELEIEGIVPDRWEARGYEACSLALEAYEKDFHQFNFSQKGYPAPGIIKKKVATDTLKALELFKNAALHEGRPLYVLIWGNMLLFNKALYTYPWAKENIRVITIGTGLMLEEHNQYLPGDWKKTDRPCTQYNWNGFGRNRLYHDPAFHDLWWLEINWTYNGMFEGEAPSTMFQKLSKYGKMGKHIQEVVKNEAWAQYFRVGDTPAVLYVIDPGHDLDNPGESSWAGKFYKPFPEKKPNYYTDYSGDLEWDYANPCNTWQMHEKVKDIAVKTLVSEREEMYGKLLEKLADLYKVK